MGYRSKSAFKSGLLVYIATYPDLIADFIRTSSNDMTEKTRNSGNSLRKTALNPHRGASNFATQNCAPLPWPRIKPPAGPPLTCFGFMSLCKQACTAHKTKTRRSRLYRSTCVVVGDTGLEPATSSVSRKRANQLRQPPVEVGTGFEPVYTALQAAA